MGHTPGWCWMSVSQQRTEVKAYPAGMGSGCGSMPRGPLHLWEAPGPEAVRGAGLVEGQIPLV